MSDVTSPSNEAPEAKIARLEQENQVLREKLKLQQEPHRLDNLKGPWCGKKVLKCGGPCCLKPDHGGDCMCRGDRDKPGSCPGKPK
jgi:hypothetical protein